MNFIDKILFENLKKDINRKFLKYNNKSFFWKIKHYSKPQYKTLLYYRLYKAIKNKPLKSFCKFLYKKNSKKSGLEIFTDKLGGGVILPHWGRILINAKEVGDNLYIFHNVTIGDDCINGKVKKIGNNVFIGTNSIILGPITIGNNVVIGAGSCVIKDIPSNSLVVGNPAKIIKNIESDYIQKMIGY